MSKKGKSGGRTSKKEIKGTEKKILQRENEELQCKWYIKVLAGLYLIILTVGLKWT